MLMRSTLRHHYPPMRTAKLRNANNTKPGKGTEEQNNRKTGTEQQNNNRTTGTEQQQKNRNRTTTTGTEQQKNRTEQQEQNNRKIHTLLVGIQNDATTLENRHFLAS